MTARRVAWAAVVAGVGVYLLPTLLEAGGAGTGVFWVSLLAGTAVAVAGWFACRRLGGGAAAVILVGAVLFRAVLLPSGPALSDDLYRYLWDGRVQVAGGINPYQHPPADPALEHLRDADVYPLINRRQVSTIYPGGAQIVFAAAHATGVRTPLPWRILTAAADVAAVALLLRLLRRRGRPAHLAVAYAWNPLPVLAFGHSGHLEALVVLAVVAAVLAWDDDRPLAAAALVGVAGALKLYPLLMLPAFLRKRDGGWVPAAGAVAAAVVAVGYLPYLTAGRGVLGYLESGYLVEEGYVSGTRFALASAVDVPGLPLAVAGVCLAGLAALLSRRHVAVRAAWPLGAGLILTTPYPWYATALVALAAAGAAGPDRGDAAAAPVWALFGVGLMAAYLTVLRPLGLEGVTVHRWTAGGAAVALAVLAASRVTLRRRVAA